MASLLINQLNNLSAELNSEKVPTRNKAAERLDVILSNSKSELIALFRSGSSGRDISWTELFRSAICATLKHAVKVEESRGTKSFQTMRNKNFIFRAIVTKLVDYNLEDDNNFMSKSDIFNAFTEGVSTRNAIEHFGSLFLYLLDRGIYKSTSYVRELKVNEFSRILSYLFELNVAHDQILSFSVLCSITRTIELAVQHVQLSSDLIEYLPEVLSFASRANSDRYKADVIKLFHLFVSQLAIDYHHTICKELQEILPVMCGFFDFRMKPETKEALFSSIYISLYAIYPHIAKGDFSTINVSLSDNWTKTLKMLKTMVDTEIKDLKASLYRSAHTSNDKSLEHFVEMAAVVTYLMYWHIERNNNVEEDLTESRPKMIKQSDKLEVILNLVQPRETEFNEIWLAILTQLLCNQDTIINSANFQPVLETTFRILHIFATPNNLRNLRLCLTAILRHENRLIADKCIPVGHCQGMWTKLVDFVISEASSNSETIAEKQLCLQALIAHGKLTPSSGSTLLQSFMANPTMRRSDCISTVRQMLIHSERIGLDKTSEIIGRIIAWSHEATSASTKIDAKKVLLNIAPIDTVLLADTCAIAVINFLNENQTFSNLNEHITAGRNAHNLEMLMYKYHRKFVCLAEHGSEMQRLQTEQVQGTSLASEKKNNNCLFQGNYELLMRLLNFETSKETTCSHILEDLSPLHKMVCLMKIFVDYGVFVKENFSQCPLMKRIGFFLSHLEFQLKSNNPRNFDTSDLFEVLHRLATVFATFTSNRVLLQYLENQPLEEIIAFLGNALKYSASQQLCNEDGFSITCTVLKTLVTLCASATHYKDAFAHVSGYKVNIKTDLNNFLNLIEIFCTHETPYADVADWFVQKLKTIFQLYHTNIEIIGQVVDMLPAIFAYVQQFDSLLGNMLLALRSLLKIAYKKSYSIQFTVKIINSVRLITRHCKGGVCGQEDFVNICLSVAVFLPFPSLEIQFATINAITALMDVNWMHITQASEVHFDFCQQLYSHINWKSLEAVTTDLKQNSNAVTIQMLVSLFVFSSYHQEIALQELSYFCALRKLKEADLYEFQQIARYYNCSLSELIKPYVTNLIHAWTAKKYPILKFPYFLCYTSISEFVASNLSKITTCLLLYGKEEDLNKLQQFGTKDELLKLALPMVHAFILPFRAGTPEAKNSDYKDNLETLHGNLNVFGIDIRHWNGESGINWETIYYAITHLRDESHYQQTFGSPIFYQQTNWFNISYSSLRRCLNFYLNKSPIEDSSTDLFATVIAKNPLYLIHVLNALKENSFACIFPIDRLKIFYMYCTMADFVVDSMPSKRTPEPQAQNCGKFFVRDIIFYILQYLKIAIQYDMQKVALVFLRHILSKPVVTDGFCSEIIKSHLNDVCKALVASAENAEMPEIEQLSINLMHFIINENKMELSEAIVSLDEFPTTENFAELREIQSSLQSSDGGKDLPSVIKSFLRMKNRGIEGLRATRQYISKNKSALQLEGKLLYELIRRLIEIVRDSGNTEFSLEAAKCLGEIGSLKIEGIFYYFEMDVAGCEDEAVSLEPTYYFVSCMLKAVEQLLLVFKLTTHRAICEVAQHLINSKQGAKLIDSQPYFNIFCSKTRTPSCLDSYVNISSFDWLTALKSTETLHEYDKWICAFVAKIFESCGWQSFQELAAQDSYFADALLQPFIKLLMAHKDCHLQNLVAMLEYFFEKMFNALNCNGGEANGNYKTIFKEKRVISKFLNICECIRLNNEWKLPVNLLYVAKACNYCQAYFMSIMYLELWALSEQSRQSTLSSNEIMANDCFQESATKAYQSIGCCDAISGFINPLQSRLHFLNLNNNWSDILLEASPAEMISDQLYTSILKRNGMLSLAGSSQGKKSVDYEVCWRLGQWDTVVEGHAKVNTLNDMEYEFEKHHFNALKCLFNREENNSLAAISNAHLCVLAILKDISVECLQSVYKYLTWLQLLQQTEEFCQVQFGTNANLNEIFAKWQVEVDLQYGSFGCKEQVLSHQIALFNTAGVRASRKIKSFYNDNPIERCLMKCIKECKNAGEINLAKRNIASLKNMTTNDQIRVSVLLEDADVSYKTGKPQITKAILQYLLQNSDFAYCLERVRAFRMHGVYLMESNTENFETVLSKYFNGSMGLLEKFGKSKEQMLEKFPNVFDLETFEDFERSNRKSTYETIAKYADREYTQLNTYANSDEFQMKCKIMEQQQQGADSFRKSAKDRDKNMGAVFIKKCALLDEKEVQSIQRKCTTNLCIAIENYMKFCQVDEESSSAAIYRIIALWFANKQNEELLLKIEENIASMPSYKFICALNQMTARLNSQHQSFLDILKDVLVRCVQDHPQQTLYQLYPLVFAFNDETGITKTNNRVNIAKEIIAKARTKSNANAIKQLENMFPALIEFANKDTQGDSKSGSTPISDKLKRLRNLDAVQCPTINLPVSANRAYNVTSVVKWEDKVALVGGINAPKKLMCQCSDGKSRPQLLKGKDDLRQDAVMQQVFSMINGLLRRDPEAIERKLMLRTYKVVPLSMRSGILEWCLNTIPIGAYVATDSATSARKKYRPKDYSHVKCRSLSMQHLKADIDKRYQAYKHICENIKPIFHYFLFEKFRLPGVWFERRLAYTNSVATTSIVGFILGLGDRHTQNILIDEKTAEVIHIDFGIAFEQGKIMPTPETVPFRLTRDMVAPMGICETNGVFKKSCEATMRILRHNQEIITTILEVLLYDPLYMWEVAQQISTDGNEEKNLTAQRALLCVQYKLEGKQAGILGASDVDVQVQRLINDAISARNLCQLYPGWDPYL